MRQPTPTARDVARFLLSQEAGSSDVLDTPAAVAERAFEKLRQSLAKFVGAAGYQALLGRALSLTKAEVHWLMPVRVNPNGSLEGLTEALTHQNAAHAEIGGAALMANLLGLLISFVGQDLTLQLVRDVYPAATLTNIYPNAEETP